LARKVASRRPKVREALAHLPPWLEWCCIA